jgi:uncharacterized protein (TIGR02001 family)
MIFTKKVTSLRMLSVAVAASVAGLAAPLAAQADVTGNINVVSKYVLRGITSGPGTENNGAALQGGFDYSHSSGLYAGYWGSSLGYTYDGTVTVSNNSILGSGFESDLYAGYKGKAGPVSYGAGAIYYAYTGVEESDGAEIALTAGIGNASLGVNYLLQDLWWGNQGDTYITLGYSQPLPADFSVAATLMYYMYTKDGKYIAETADSVDSAFRGVSVAVTHPLGKTGGTMGLTLVGGGENRVGAYQKFMPVLSVGMTF